MVIARWTWIGLLPLECIPVPTMKENLWDCWHDFIQWFNVVICINKIRNVHVAGTGFSCLLAVYFPCAWWEIYLLATCCTISAGTGWLPLVCVLLCCSPACLALSFASRFVLHSYIFQCFVFISISACYSVLFTPNYRKICKCVLSVCLMLKQQWLTNSENCHH